MIELESDAELYRKANILIEDIFKFKKEKCEGLSIMETIIEYGDQFNIPIQELGNIMADHKDYIEIFKNQLIKDKYFKSEYAEDEKDFNDEEW